MPGILSADAIGGNLKDYGLDLVDKQY